MVLESSCTDLEINGNIFFFLCQSCVILLGLLLLYDVFFVFITPFITKVCVCEFVFKINPKMLPGLWGSSCVEQISDFRILDADFLLFDPISHSSGLIFPLVQAMTSDACLGAISSVKWLSFRMAKSKLSPAVWQCDEEKLLSSSFLPSFAFNTHILEQVLVLSAVRCELYTSRKLVAEKADTFLPKPPVTSSGFVVWFWGFF